MTGSPKDPPCAVFLDFATVDRGDLDLSPLRAQIRTLKTWDSTSEDTLDERLDGPDVVIVNKVRLDAGTLERARPDLVCLAATGSDNVDILAARRAGIGVTNIRNYCTDSVAQHTLALLLAVTVRLVDYRAELISGAWSESATFTLLDLPVRELAGKTLAVVGYGTLGRAVAQRAHCFGMQVLIAERRGIPARAGRVSFEDALSRADVVSLHAPLTEETRGMIDKQTLGLMRHDAVLINTARGALVDEPALAEALRTGQLGGAGLDVLSDEPPPRDHPLLDPTLPNCLVTPHIAWASREARQRAINEIAENIAAWRAGERRNRLD